MQKPHEVSGKLLIKLGNKVFEQVIRGQGNYTQHLAELQKLLDKARQLAYPQSIARLLNNISAVYTYTGRLQESLRQDRELLDYIKAHDLGVVLVVSNLNNQAVTLEIQRRFSEAIQTYDEAIQYAKDHANGQPVYEISAYSLAVAGKMSALVQAQRLAEVPPLYAYLESIAENLVAFSRNRYAEAMMMAFRAMAEFNLYEARLNEAVSFCNLSLEFAAGFQVEDEIGSIYYTLARIALVQNRVAEAEAYIQKGDSIFANQPETVLAGLHLLGAFYDMQRFGFSKQAESFRQRAQVIFEKWDATECLALLAP